MGSLGSEAEGNLELLQTVFKPSVNLSGKLTRLYMENEQTRKKLAAEDNFLAAWCCSCFASKLKSGRALPLSRSVLRRLEDYRPAFAAILEELSVRHKIIVQQLYADEPQRLIAATFELLNIET